MSYQSDSKDFNESKLSRSDEKDSKRTPFEDKQSKSLPAVNIEIISLGIRPSGLVLISSPLDLAIEFDLDRDVSNCNWVFKFLVDSCEKRIIRILGETKLEDYPRGVTETSFHVDTIDVSGIPPSTLANSGLLIAEFIVENEAIAAINMVVNVKKNGDQIVREIYSPLE